MPEHPHRHCLVLIESDWNLKDNFRTGFLFGEESINRIRLEFKVKSGSNTEKKASVLIESDWNLKANKH